MLQKPGEGRDDQSRSELSRGDPVGSNRPAQLAGDGTPIKHSAPHHDEAPADSPDSNHSVNLDSLSTTDSTATGDLTLDLALLDGLPDAFMVTDVRLRIRLVNAAAKTMYGFDPEHVIGTPIVDLVETELGEGVSPDDALSALTEHGPWQGRVRQRPTGKQWMVVDANARVLADRDGNPTGAVFVARDVTSLLAAEQEVEERTQFASAVLESLPGRTCVLDGDGRVIATNHQYLEEGPTGAGEHTGPKQGADYVAWLTDILNDDATIDLRELLRGNCRDFRTEFQTVQRRTRRWTELFAVPLCTEAGGAVVTHVDITERKQAENALTQRATHDPLTGLPNRVLLADRLAHALSRAARSKTQVGLLFCDLDGFREVNNSFGHLAGDRLLVTIAKRLRAVCRSSDTVARVSGDEFVIILEDVAGTAEMEDVAQRIIDALAEPVVMDEGTARTGTSAGLVISPGVSRAGMRTVENMIRDADAAMYAAKEAGRGRYAWFAPEMREKPRERPTFVRAINRLLNR
ncbi:MAG: diguanylate cyclase domain-containing protein [Candidatus Nanopelagicales bacterium]